MSYRKNIMKKIMMKWSKLILMPFLCLFLINAYAAENNSSSLEDYSTKIAGSQDIYQINSAEDVSKDLTKRMILGILVKML